MALAQDTSYSAWMGTLPQSLHGVPVNSLAIPGSHDSFAFFLDEHSHLGPDYEWYFRALEDITGPLGLDDIIYRWSVTQLVNFTQQLESGVRYFDLRIALKPGTDDIYLLHGFYGVPLETALEEILVFLDVSPTEIVLLDFNHVYNMSDFVVKQCFSMVLEKFGDKMCPFQNAKDVTLANLWKKNQQVLVFFASDVVKANPMFWPVEYMQSPWPETVDVKELLDFLEKDYEKKRDEDRFYVTQGVLTPTPLYIVEHFSDSLQADLATAIAKPFVDWLKGKKAGPQGINVCIMDFVQMADYIPTVIGMNKVDE